MRIFAHRCFRNGPEPRLENGLAAFSACLADGFAVETDIRRWKDGTFYISHAPRPYTDELQAGPYLEALARSKAGFVALNVKELGYEKDLLGLLRRHGVAEKIFLFDMEFLEDIPGKTAGKFRAIAPNISVAARVSDRGESVERALGIEAADTIWADEMDRLWLSRDVIAQLHEAEKRVYAISPEIQGFGTEAMVARWADFIGWGIDGICTDYPDRLSDFLAIEVSDSGRTASD